MANKKRLIDQNELIDWLTRATCFRTNCEDCTCTDCLDCIVEECIINFATVDAVEVVRCKDCKNSSGTRIEHNTCVCFKHGMIMSADHFCSWGERRYNENT